MDQLWDQKESVPDHPGRYWVLRRIVVQGQLRVCDDGYAYWNGEKWDRTDWDKWYGTPRIKMEIKK